MQVIYAREPFPTSVRRTIFLAGPTPRSAGVPSWRPEALKLLESFDGHVFVPESRDGLYEESYDAQVEWETAALNRADVIVFWVPRDLETMPAFTTNVEFGLWCNSGKVVFGAPPEAPKNRFLEYHAAQAGLPMATSLEETLRLARERVPAPMLREGGEVEVPYHVWNTSSFQGWIRAQKGAGNRLDGAKVLWSFKGFLWAVHMNVWVASEGRHKSNEIVLARPDISCVVLFRFGATLMETEIALVKEFRSTVRNAEAFVYETPGGSSPKASDRPEEVAVTEVMEETGLVLDPSRIRKWEDRQLVATMSAHHAHLFSAELTVTEMDWLKSRRGLVLSAEGSSERTTVEVHTLREIVTENKVDWSMLGLIYRVVAGV